MIVVGTTCPDCGHRYSIEFQTDTGKVVLGEGTEDQIIIEGSRITFFNGIAARLTKTEQLVLERLIMSIEQTVRNEQLLTDVWGPEYIGDLQYLRVWVSRLRRAGFSKFIRTIPGRGYLITRVPGTPGKGPSNKNNYAYID